jgi:hypothetical protein
MQESGLISDYAELLARELSFDQSLSRCVRQEVEDHLWDAVAADPSRSMRDAERHAIANFGDPHVIAAQFAVLSLARQTTRAGVAVILTVAGVFIAMKARVTWYAAMQWTMTDDLKAVSGLIGSIDSCAFWLSFIIGIVGWVYIGSRPAPAAHPAYRKHLRRCFLLSTAATGALIVSVISDAVLTALRLFGTGLSVEFLVPVVLMGVEIVCASILIFRIQRTRQRTASTAALLKT